MIKNYQILEKIGKGTFGIVYKVKRINDPLIYVIKQISLNGLTEIQVNQVNTEAKLLSLIKSNYVVKYYESFLEGEDLNIVMEYCDNGDLCKYLSEQKKPLKEDLIWQIFIKITLGLTTIHKMKILHRDLKTLNIFLKKDMEIKIGDLGVAKELNQASFASTLIGTPYYLSPEMCEDKPYNEKSDVWALGCILYELCTYRHPFNATNHGALILKILNSNPEPILAIYSQKLQKLVNEILEKNLQKRPNCWDILNNPSVIEKAKQFGLYQEILYVFSNNSQIENIPNEFIQNKYVNNTYNMNYIPLDSEDILLKSQLAAPNYIDNKVLVRKLNKEEKKVLKINHNNKREAISLDKNKKNNINQNYYVNDIDLNGYNKFQNGIQYGNIDNINLINDNIYNNNNYLRNTEYRNINYNNNFGLINNNYFLNTNNFNNLYNNNINQNNNIIYNQILINNNTLDNRQLSSIINPIDEPVKIAKVTRIYNNSNQPIQTQILNQNNNNNIYTEERDIVDISDSLNSLNISLKPAPIDMDRINDKLGNSTNTIETKKDSEDNFFSYPPNSDMPMDNCNEQIPLDNFRNSNKNTHLQIVSNENIEVRPTIQKLYELDNNQKLDEKNVNKTNKKSNISTPDRTLRNRQYSDINIKNHKKGINNNNEIYFNNNKLGKNITVRYQKKKINDNSIKNKTNRTNRTNKDKPENNILNSNHKNKKKIFNIANILYKKKTKEKILKTNPFGDILDTENKLNKTSINLSSSDNFNINIDYQEPIPIELQEKNSNINNEEMEDFNLLENNDNPINISDEIKKDEQEIPKIDDIELEQEDQLRIKEEINSLENKYKKVQNDMNLLIGEKDYKNVMDLYLKAKNKDNIYVEIENYFNNNNFAKNKKEKFFELYFSLTSFESKINKKKDELQKLFS